MNTPEAFEKNEPEFLESVSDNLTQIHGVLFEMRVITQEGLPEGKVDEICGTLTNLEKEAQNNGDEAMSLVLGKLNAYFYSLNTVELRGDENRVKFSDKAADISDLLEVTLLALGKSVQKNEQEIIRRIKEKESN